MRAIARFLLGLGATAIILLAVALWGLRLAMVNIEYFKPEIEYLLTGDEASDIVFTGLGGDMNRFNPVVRVENVSITLEDGSQPLFIDYLTVEFDFWGSILEMAPVMLEVEGALEKIELTRDEDGRWWANQYELGANNGRTRLDDLTRTLVFVPRYLQLDLRRLILNDRVNGEVHQLDRVSAHIDQRDDHYLLQASAALPEQLGRGILIKSRIGAERSQVYVNTSDLRLQPAAELLGLEAFDLRQGSLDGELWINLSGMNLQAINGDIVLKDAEFRSRNYDRPLEVDFHSRFNAIRRPDNWRVINEVERISIDRRNLPGFRSQMQIDTGDRPFVSAWIDRLQLAKLAPIAAYFLPLETAARIEQMQPEGLARNLVLLFDPAQTENLSIAAQLERIAYQPVGEIPGLTNINGELTVGRQKLAVSLGGENVRVDAPKRMRAPFELDRLQLDAVAHRDGDRLQLAVDRLELANPDIRAGGRMWLEYDGVERPFMFLRAEFGDGQAENKSKYLPLGLMPEKTLAWLDAAVIGGQIPRGELQYHGRLRDIRKLDREQAVEFFVDFEVQDGELRFAPDWQPARNGHGRILFHNIGLDIELDRIDYDRIEQARATARIANLESPLLEIAVAANAPADAAIQSWLGTPVAESFRDPLGNLQDIIGRVETGVDIAMPLKSGMGPPQVRVNVDFADVGLREENWGVELTEARGRLQIEDQRISASGIEARFYGDSITLDVAPKADSDETVISARGRIETGHLLQRLPARLVERVRGKSDWQIRLSLPGAQREETDALLSINAASNLVDTELALPSPFTKAGAVDQRVSVDIDVFEQSLQLDLAYADSVLARGSFAIADGAEPSLETFDVAFGRPLKNNRHDGLSLYGDIAELSVDEWKSLLDSIDADDPGVLRSVDLNLGRLDLFGRPLDAVDLTINRVDGGLVGLVEARQIRGAFDLRAGQPARVELDYLRIDKLERAADYSDLHPAEMEALFLTSKQLDFHDMTFTDLRIDSRVLDGVFYIDQFTLRRDGLLLDGTAQWRYDETEQSHLTSVSTTIQGDQFGQAIDGLGFGDSMRDGSVDFSGSFTWPAPPFGFALENLRGSAKLKLEDGFLNNVEPGSGRLVGLLSLSALPRRLSLDFNDLLIKGMKFESISGSYELRDGQLLTDNTRMEGPAAKIRIRGRTGLIDRDYDQVMRITPRYRDVLNLALLLQSNWGLLLLQNLFKKQIDQAAEIEYQISGSWDNPKIELLKAVDENQVELPNIEK